MPAKLQFSEQESSIVKDAELILTKNSIITKLQQVFGGIAASLQLHMNQSPEAWPAEVLKISPKISKGEQYQELPYVMLDYPRFFSREDVMAVRCFFWWGHHCSVTLHLKGSYLSKYLPALRKSLEAGHLIDFKMATTGDEWNHNLLSSDYQPVNTALLELESCEFLKIGQTLPLENWPSMEENLLQLAKQLLEAIK